MYKPFILFVGLTLGLVACQSDTDTTQTSTTNTEVETTEPATENTTASEATQTPTANEEETTEALEAPVALNLLANGVPKTIQAPANFDLQDNSGVLRDLVIKAGQPVQYYVQVTGGVARANNIAAIKKELLQEEKSKDSFVEILEEDANGFLFAIKFPGESNTRYNFRHILLKNGEEFVFKTTNNALSNFDENLEQVKMIYASIK